jgi:hypothetical protein
MKDSRAAKKAKIPDGILVLIPDKCSARITNEKSSPMPAAKRLGAAKMGFLLRFSACEIDLLICNKGLNFPALSTLNVKSAANKTGSATR